MKPYLLLMIISLGWLAACHKSGPPAPSIIKLDPQEGAASIPVMITGLHFDTVISHITVKFNGVIAKVFSATDSAVGVLVPTGAATMGILDWVVRTARYSIPGIPAISPQ